MTYAEASCALTHARDKLAIAEATFRSAGLAFADAREEVGKALVVSNDLLRAECGVGYLPPAIKEP